jgi:hypothetical protein
MRAVGTKTISAMASSHRPNSSGSRSGAPDACRRTPTPRQRARSDPAARDADCRRHTRRTIRLPGQIGRAQQVSCQLPKSPPYHNIVVYSGEVWVRVGQPNDLSRCATEEEFLEKLMIALKNRRHATRPSGYYGAITGDGRRGGVYSSYQANLITRMPKKEQQRHRLHAARRIMPRVPSGDEQQHGESRPAARVPPRSIGVSALTARLRA